MTRRYVEFEVQTLSFEEYREMKRFLGQAVDLNPVAKLDHCIFEGGFSKALDYPKCTRFDMKSRKSLQGEQKYYLADLSFYFALDTDKDSLSYLSSI
ncbi:hypothetical protein QUW40_09410 [Collinsella tanakaei]|uniref:hypothetical protein n=1 Tax=Collinsella tanakaei TaxID=626935 RepID=UPI0025A43514|nr:hypothetical protein [Collinsella tanakaei]MDM8246813.1 hypothetical protein [Collinsella tanakaei]